MACLHREHEVCNVCIAQYIRCVMWVNWKTSSRDIRNLTNKVKATFAFCNATHSWWCATDGCIEWWGPLHNIGWADSAYRWCFSKSNGEEHAIQWWNEFIKVLLCAKCSRDESELYKKQLVYQVSCGGLMHVLRDRSIVKDFIALVWGVRSIFRRSFYETLVWWE